MPTPQPPKKLGKQGLKGRGNRVPKHVYDSTGTSPEAIDKTIERIDRRLRAQKETEQARRALEGQIRAEARATAHLPEPPRKRGRLQYTGKQLGAGAAIGMGASLMPTRQPMVSKVGPPEKVQPEPIAWRLQDVYDQLRAGYRWQQVARRTRYSHDQVLDVAEDLGGVGSDGRLRDFGPREPQPVGVVLRQARLKAGLSVSEVAHKAYISRGYLARLEAGERKMPDFTLTKLLRALDLDEQEFRQSL